MQRKCARLTESLQHWRTKISNNMKEAESRNKALKEEKDKVIGHYQELKGRMNRVRDAEDKRLTDLTLNARGTIGDLTDKLTMAERILKLAELNRKLMTEREKVHTIRSLLTHYPLSIHSLFTNYPLNHYSLILHINE